MDDGCSPISRNHHIAMEAMAQSVDPCWFTYIKVVSCLWVMLVYQGVNHRAWRTVYPWANYKNYKCGKSSLAVGDSCVFLCFFVGHVPFFYVSLCCWVTTTTNVTPIWAGKLELIWENSTPIRHRKGLELLRIFPAFRFFFWIHGSVHFPCYLQHFEPGGCYFRGICSILDFEPSLFP